MNAHVFFGWYLLYWQIILSYKRIFKIINGKAIPQILQPARRGRKRGKQPTNNNHEAKSIIRVKAGISRHLKQVSR
jgi:hypothetical protein